MQSKVKRRRVSKAPEPHEGAGDRMRQDKEWDGPMLGPENGTNLASPITLSDTWSWETPDDTVHTLPVVSQDCVVVSEWVATLWESIELKNTLEHVTSFVASDYVARVDHWGFNVMRLAKAEPRPRIQLTNDGVTIDGHVQTSADGAQQVEDTVVGQDVPAYFPAMLCDRDRNRQFKEAIQKCVQAFKNTQGGARLRVVDVGSGTGLLTHYALEAGADHVTAVEGNAFRATILRERFQTDSRVDVFEGLSTMLEPSEPFDMIITETLGTWAHFEKGHVYLKDLLDRKVALSSDYVVPRRIRQFLTFRTEGEFASQPHKKTRQISSWTRYGIHRSLCADTRVDGLWEKLLPKVGDPPINMFENMRLFHGYLQASDGGDLLIGHPQNLAPHQLDGSKQLTLPEKYRIARTFKLKRV